MKRLFLGLMLILFIGVACTPALPVDDEIGETAAATETAVPTEIIIPTDVPPGTETRNASEPSDLSDTVIVYNRSGGFAGLQQEWTIYSDGRIILPDGSQKQIDPTQVQAVFDAIATANFQSLKASYVPKDTCCDRFTHVITVQTGGETHTVTTVDQAPDEPVELAAVLEAINELIQTIQ